MLSTRSAVVRNDTVTSAAPELSDEQDRQQAERQRNDYRHRGLAGCGRGDAQQDGVVGVLHGRLCLCCDIFGGLGKLTVGLDPLLDAEGLLGRFRRRGWGALGRRFLGRRFFGGRLLRGRLLRRRLFSGRFRGLLDGLGGRFLLRRDRSAVGWV